MNEFEHDDFNAFLADAVEKDSFETDRDAHILTIQAAVNDALKDSGYVSVQDPEEHRRLEEIIIETYRINHPDALGEEAQIRADEIIARIDMHDVAAIAMIQMLIASNEYDQMVGKPTNPTYEKRKLYAELLVKDRRDPNDAILRALNSAIPGDEVEPDEEYMVPFIAEAMQIQEDREFKSIQRDAEIRSIMFSIGMSEDDADWQAVLNDVQLMYLQAIPYMRTKDNRANLSAELHEMKVNAVNPQQRQKLIDFFIAY